MKRLSCRHLNVTNLPPNRFAILRTGSPQFWRRVFPQLWRQVFPLHLRSEGTLTDGSCFWGFVASRNSFHWKWNISASRRSWTEKCMWDIATMVFLHLRAFELRRIRFIFSNNTPGKSCSLNYLRQVTVAVQGTHFPPHIWQDLCRSR